MVIYYLSHSTFPSEDPSSLQVTKTLDALAQEGHRCFLFGFANPAYEESPHEFYSLKENIEVIRFSRLKIRGLGMAKYAWEITRACKSMGMPDAFYAREAYSLLGCSRFSRPLYYEAHVPPHNTFKKALENRVFKQHNFCGLVVTAASLKDYYIEAFPSLDHAAIRVIRNGAQIPIRSVSTENTAEHPVEAQRFQVGYIGNLTVGRGMELIQSMAERNPGIDFHVLGGRPAELTFWKEKVSLPNVSLHGFIPQAGLSAWYDRFDLMLAPYGRQIFNYNKRFEYARWISPLKIFDYMAHEKTILASNLPAIREILTHRVNAWLAPPDDAAAWNEALRKLSGAPKDRAAMAKKAFSDASQHFTWERRAEQILDLIGRRQDS